MAKKKKPQEPRNLRAASDSLTNVNKNNPWVNRYLQGNSLSIPDVYNPGSGKTSSHGLSYHPLTDSTAMIYPEIIQQGDSLVKMDNDQAREYAIKNKTGITTDLELAKYYSENGLIQHQQGGKIMASKDKPKSKIHIKPSKRGSLHEHLGVPKEKKIPASKLSIKPGDSPAIRKKKQFAINARKWNHEIGGMLYNDNPTFYEFGGKIPEKTPLASTGLSAGKKPSQYSEQQIRLGMDVEFEHTKNKALAAKIAMDHLEEDPMYYGTGGKANAEKLAQQHSAKEAAEKSGKFQDGGKLPSNSKLKDGVIYNTKGDTIRQFIPSENRFINEPVSAFRPRALPSVLDQARRNNIEGGLVEPLPVQIPMRQQYGLAESQENPLAPYMPEYGFGSWLKDNGAGLLKGAGSLVSMIPGIGQIAGPVLSTAGSVIGGVQQKNAQQDAAQAEADAAQAAAENEQRLVDRNTRTGNIVDKNQMAYAPTFAMGGGLMQGGGNPQITDYTNGQTHEGSQGGIPVDARGNPATTSKSSVVGLTEKGEVTWNGYVFSDKIKIS